MSLLGLELTSVAGISPEQYLEAEEVAPRKHEYADGCVYAMAGGTPEHSLIAANVLAFVHAHLRGKPCRVFGSDMKIRVRRQFGWRFYYPDLQAVCRPVPRSQLYQEEPTVVIEVLSESTRRTDEQEKQEAYLSLPSVVIYILLEQDQPLATVWRRDGSNFHREVWASSTSTVPLPEIAMTLPLKEVYEGLTFPERRSHSDER